MNTAVVLYGAPACGKSATSAALHALDARFVPYRPVKCGRGRRSGYVMVSADELERLRTDHADVLWERCRYGAIYLWLRSALRTLVATGACPVVELGQPEAVEAITAGLPDLTWTVVELRCPRPVAEQRITARATGDEDERLAVYDATPRLDRADLSLDTSTTSTAGAAAIVAARIAD